MINILGLTLGLASAVIAIAMHCMNFPSKRPIRNADRIAAIYLNGNFGDISWFRFLWPRRGSLEAMFPEMKAQTLSRSISNYGQGRRKPVH